MSPKYVAITGGPGSGKTTVVEALAARGYVTVPEAAIQVIGELNGQLGLDGQQRWRRANSEAFQELVLQRQIQLEQACAGEPGLVFLDRGRLDGLGYLRHFGVQPSDRLLEQLLACPYEHVVLLETLRSFADRRESGRMSRHEDSLAIAACIASAYTECGHVVHTAPEMAVEERVRLILEIVGAE